MMKCICELYVICGMYVESCTVLVVVNRLSRPVVVLDGLPGLYGFKYDSATACGLPLYLYSYKLVGSATRKVLTVVSSQLARSVDICCHVYIAGYDERSIDTNKQQLLLSQTRELGRNKCGRTLAEHLACFDRWL